MKSLAAISVVLACFFACCVVVLLPMAGVESAVLTDIRHGPQVGDVISEHEGVHDV